MTPKLKCFVENVDNGKKSKPPCKSFSVARKHVLHERTSLKLKQNCCNLSSVFTEKANSCFFFLNEDLRTILVCVLPQFMKADKLVHFDFKDIKNQCNITDVDLYYVGEKEVRALIMSNISQCDTLEVWDSCRRLLVSLAGKLLQKSPTTYSTPRKMTTWKDKQKCINKMKTFMNSLVESRQICVSDVEEVLAQYSSFLYEVIPQNQSLLADFDP
ncbi:hypothetical protein PR048_020884 [Dryococelus australis]|uniref:Uncharacterized protein n=1 Tax=Dryococelus australis TaxID=614101 RepID=A0ABQ9GWN9_9NEOP|nr:hypothetical protein PR048_020884 [Dryococelus australis]